MFSRSTQSRQRAAAGSAGPSRAGSRKPVEHGDRDVVGDRLAQVEAERQPVLGDIGDAGRDRRPGSRKTRAGAPRRAISPLSSRVMPNSASASSVRPAPSSPMRPSTSPSCDGEGDVLEFAGAGRRRALRARRLRSTTAAPTACARCFRRSSARPAGGRRSRRRGKVPTLRPSRSTVTRSAISTTSSSRWLTKTTPTPCSFRRAPLPAAGRPRGGSATRSARP